MNHRSHQAELQRLRRIEGQVRGVIGMVEEGRYCVDILTQLRAVHAALRKVEEQILREHVDHCVVGAVKSGRKDDQRAKLDELMAVISRFSV
jgi:DNA-binding FrmR family transcriptional regulator